MTQVKPRPLRGGLAGGRDPGCVGRGDAAVAEGLAGPVTKPLMLEVEALPRVFLSPSGTEDDLKSTLLAIRHDIAGLLDLADRISDEDVYGRAPFQRPVPIQSMVHDFLFRFGDPVDRRAERSLARTEAWPDQTRTERPKAAHRMLVLGR